jgi:hypothetical protein
MNEGCDGGWPFFHGFMAENGYLVTDECAPYKGKTKGDSCSNYAECQPHSKIQKTSFIGKGYGDASETKIMKEIARNGIVNGELQAPHIFSMYQSGVLTTQGIKKLHNHVLGLAQIKAGEKAAIDEELGIDADADTEKSGDVKKVPIGDKTLEDYGISW